MAFGVEKSEPPKNTFYEFGDLFWFFVCGLKPNISDVRELREQFKNHITCMVDEDKPELVLCCPEGYSKRCLGSVEKAGCVSDFSFGELMETYNGYSKKFE